MKFFQNVRTMSRNFTFQSHQSCLVLIYFSWWIYEIFGSYIVREIRIYVREKSGKCQGILCCPMCRNPELIHIYHLRFKFMSFFSLSLYLARPSSTGDPCLLNPCLNSGICHTEPAPRGFECICDGGFQGRDCETSKIIVHTWTSAPNLKWSVHQA